MLDRIEGRHLGAFQQQLAVQQSPVECAAVEHGVRHERTVQTLADSFAPHDSAVFLYGESAVRSQPEWHGLCPARDARRPAARVFIQWYRDPKALPKLLEDWEIETTRQRIVHWRQRGIKGQPLAQYGVVRRG
ncbi:hypothetical protein ACFZCY_42705 [Streptomyces sp. NPDC007983]|uniref:hypothetical protein n=1 Tax=Streptomyces sp. NPDC007983 TaxID=3364800 RepID=UPI0036EBB85E